MDTKSCKPSWRITVLHAFWGLTVLRNFLGLTTHWRLTDLHNILLGHSPVHLSGSLQSYTTSGGSQSCITSWTLTILNNFLGAHRPAKLTGGSQSSITSWGLTIVHNTLGAPSPAQYPVGSLRADWESFSIESGPLLDSNALC